MKAISFRISCHSCKRAHSEKTVQVLARRPYIAVLVVRARHHLDRDDRPRFLLARLVDGPEGTLTDLGEDLVAELGVILP